MMNRDMPFLGTGWGFPPDFSKSSRTVGMTSGETDIRKSLYILLNVALGERVMAPSYGCRLRQFVFEPADDTLITYIKDLVTKAIAYHEPRIVLEDVEVAHDATKGKLSLTLIYTIPATNTRSNIVFPFYLSEGTEVGIDYTADLEST